MVLGAGIIGLSLALELHSRGHSVTVLEKDRALSGASSAAAGMLAADDPHNPAALAPLSHFSLGLYPAFLQRLAKLSGISVPFHTELTIQHLAHGHPPELREHSVELREHSVELREHSVELREHSLDPRQLGAALLRAVRATSIALHEGQPFSPAHPALARADILVHATGAWYSNGRGSVFPRKGQLLRVRLPANAPLREVHRGEEVYIVPRTAGPQAGTAVIGATVEDAGFDLTTCKADLDRLRALVSRWVPQVASAAEAPAVESWAGIRPATRDGLPLLGEISAPPNRPGLREFVAAGHFRNGILLAPGTARLMADLIEGRPPAVDLTPFDPGR